MTACITEFIHPGEILMEEFLKPLGVSQYRLAKDINVDPRRVNEIVLAHRSISGYGPAALPILRDVGTVLAKPADTLRPRGAERVTR